MKLLSTAVNTMEWLYSIPLVRGISCIAIAMLIGMFVIDFWCDCKQEVRRWEN